mgnify:CR=1 FL=1
MYSDVESSIQLVQSLIEHRLAIYVDMFNINSENVESLIQLVQSSIEHLLSRLFQLN